MPINYLTVKIAAGLTAKLPVVLLPGAGPLGEDLAVPAIVDFPSRNSRTTQKIVGATPTKLIDDFDVLANRRFIRLQNLGPQPVEISEDPNVAFGSGIQLIQFGDVEEEYSVDIVPYVVGGGSSDLRIRQRD